MIRRQNWLPEKVTAAFGGLKQVTIADLLTMASGLPDYLDDSFYEESLARLEAGWSSDEILRWAVTRAAGEPRLFKPGTSFDYSNTNFLLAQLALEQAAGRSMHEIFADQLFKPSGVKDTQLLGFDIGPAGFAQGFERTGDRFAPVGNLLTGYGFGDGGLVSTAADVATFYRALFVERSLLSETGLERLLHDPTGEGYGMGLEVEQPRGFGVVLGHSGGDVGFSADVRHVLGEDVTVVFLSAEEEDDLDITWQVLDELR